MDTHGIQKMNNTFFITGTDTNIGKTEITCALIEFFKQNKKITLGMKPIAAGTEMIDKQKINSDVYKFLKVNSLKMPVEIINPYSFDEAIAPHIASSKAKVIITLSEIKKKYQFLKKNCDYLFLEGAGGYFVPLGDNQATPDLISYLDIPIILVVGVKLGCINHTMLTVDAIKKNNHKLFGWVANRVDSQMQEPDANIKYLTNKIGAPLLGDIPFITNINSKKVAHYLVWPESL